MNTISLSHLKNKMCQLTVRDKNGHVVEFQIVRQHNVLHHAVALGNRHDAAIDRSTFEGYP